MASGNLLVGIPSPSILVDYVPTLVTCAQNPTDEHI